MKTSSLNTPKMMGIATILALASPVAAFWRMECRSSTGFGRLDPLMDFGTISEHAHTFHGGSGFSASATPETLLASKCTSCAAAEDKSAYWTPALYFQSTSGKFTVVPQVGGMLAYYFLNPAPGSSKITAFPKGFQMIAGDNNQRNFTLPVPDPPQSSWSFLPGQETQAGLAAKAIGFNCLNYQATPEGSLYRHFLPTKAYTDANCPDGLRLEMMFPSCWDGKNVDSANHKDHVAYPDLVMNGNCPSGFSVRLPGLFYETIWDTNAFKGQDGQFVLANGDPTGYGYHADFIMGWDEDFLQAAVNTCTNLSGRVQDCPLFTIQSEPEMATCKFELPANDPISKILIAEDVTGPIARLPGNQAIQYGPEYAKTSARASASQTVVTSVNAVPTLSYSKGASALSSGSYVPGAIFVLQTTTTAEVAALQAPTVQAKIVSETPVAAVTPVSAAPSITPAPTLSGKIPYTTIYSTNGNQVIEMVMVAEIVTEETTSTTTRYVRNRKRHGQDHQHRHVAV